MRALTLSEVDCVSGGAANDGGIYGTVYTAQSDPFVLSGNLYVPILDNFGNGFFALVEISPADIIITADRIRNDISSFTKDALDAVNHALDNIHISGQDLKTFGTESITIGTGAIAVGAVLTATPLAPAAAPAAISGGLLVAIGAASIALGEMHGH